MRLPIFLLVVLMTAACAHEAENTGMENSSVITMPATYAMVTPSAAAGHENDNSPVTAGRISRYERKVIVPGGPDGEMTPCAQSFDAVMDHLEGLMASQIEENNRIAAQQAAIPGYEF